MKKSMFRWGFVLSMLLGLLITGVMAAEVPAKTDCNGHTGWTEVNSVADLGAVASNRYRPAAGHYVLMENIDLGSDYWRSPSSGDITICLNGHTLTSSYGSYVLRNGNATMTVCDCKGSGQVVKATEGRIVEGAGGTIVLEGGTFTLGEGVTANYGINLTAGGSIVINGATITGVNGTGFAVGAGATSAVTGANIVMVSGSVTGNPLTGTNAAVTVPANCTFTMTGGTISGFGDDGTKTISGGTFTEMGVDDVSPYLTEEMPVYIEAVGDGCVVTPGYKRIGSTKTFGSTLNFGVQLSCDNDFAGNILCTVDGVEVIPVIEDGIVTVTATGIAAKDMGKEIAFVVKSADGETTYYSDDLSVADVAAEEFEEADADYQTLLADMINYGKAAAAEFDGDEITVDLGTGTIDLTQDWSRNVNDYGVHEGAAHKMFATLSLKDKIELNIYHEGEDLHKTDIAIAEALGSTTKVFEDGCTVTYSIKDYILDVLNNGVDDDQDALIGALQKYIDSVYNAING